MSVVDALDIQSKDFVRWGIKIKVEVGWDENLYFKVMAREYIGAGEYLSKIKFSRDKQGEYISYSEEDDLHLGRCLLDKDGNLILRLDGTYVDGVISKIIKEFSEKIRPLEKWADRKNKDTFFCMILLQNKSPFFKDGHGVLPSEIIEHLSIFFKEYERVLLVRKFCF